MLANALRVLNATPGTVKARVIGLYAFLIAFNVVAWALTLAASTHYPLLLAWGGTAYVFGLRHAVDADHIAAIDNTTRKLMQEGKRPIGVGFFFSLGHSTIVVALSILLAAATVFITKNMQGFKTTGSIIGTSVSCLFLLLIGIINLLVLIDIVKMWRQVSRGGSYDDKTLDEYLNNRGLLARILRPALRLVSKSWHMYLVGLLFGLGFDTASEVGLMGLSTTAGSKGMPIVLILLLPALFTAGMALIDTTDGILMLGAYGWAFVKPVRKLYYNMNITLISVLIALGIGGVEGLQILSTQFNWTGSFWSFINDTLDFGTIGYYIIGIFLLSWVVSTVVYKWRGYDNLSETSGGAGLASTAG